MSDKISELVREDRINAITDSIVEAALCEALSMRLGAKSILESLRRAIEIIEKLDQATDRPTERHKRYQELRAWLGLPTIPDAAATVNGSVIAS